MSSRNHYPPFIPGDRICTYNFYNHGRSPGNESTGVLVSVVNKYDMTYLDESTGAILPVGEVTIVTEPAPRPVFDPATRIKDVEEAIRKLRELETEFFKLQKMRDDAQTLVENLQRDFTYNKPRDFVCEHPLSVRMGPENYPICGLCREFLYGY